MLVLVVAVILTSMQKEELEEQLSQTQIDYKNTDVIVRSGHAYIQADLNKVRISVLSANRLAAACLG